MGQSMPACQPDDAESGGGSGDQRCRLEQVNSSSGEIGPQGALTGPVASGVDPAIRGAAPAAGQRGIPFIVQAGHKLFMVASESSLWVLAELRFDSASCTFAEARRVRYDWPREAFGAMLARVAVGDEMDHDLINRVTADFSEWLASQFTSAHRA